MSILRNTIEERLPFISIMVYGSEEYVGIIINQDKHVTSFYDFKSISSTTDLAEMLAFGDQWWWESNRLFPITTFFKGQIEKFDYAIKTFNSKDVSVVLGPITNLQSLSSKRIKRKTIQLNHKSN